MTAPRPSGTTEPEVMAGRLETEYAGYGESARKARAWAPENPGNRIARQELMDALFFVAARQLGGSGDILDLGCGTGSWVHDLSARVQADRIYGVDAVPNRISEAQRATPSAHFVEGDARKLPFEADRFALILLFTVLLDMPTPQDIAAVVRECERVLAPGGMLVIYEPRVPNPFNRNTRPIRRSQLELPMQSRTLTLLPPLARRLGRFTAAAYPALNRIGALHTHRLWWYSK